MSSHTRSLNPLTRLRAAYVRAYAKTLREYYEGSTCQEKPYTA